MNMIILSISSTLSQAKGAVYAYWGVYQGARAQHEEDDDGDDDDFADKAVWGVHHQRGRVHQEASGKDIYGDGQHFLQTQVWLVCQTFPKSIIHLSDHLAVFFSTFLSYFSSE